MAKSLVQIDYALAGPRPRRWLRWAVIGSFVAAASFTVFKCAPTLRDRWIYLQAQNRCLGYMAPPEQVVYDDNPVRQTLLVGLPGYVGPEATYAGGRAVWFRPGWVERADGRQRARGPIAFVHERTTPGGAKRLLIVEVQRAFLLGSDELVILPRLYELGSWAKDARCLTDSPNSWDGSGVLSGYVRVYAGQPDPADPTTRRSGWWTRANGR